MTAKIGKRHLSLRVINKNCTANKAVDTGIRRLHSLRRDCTSYSFEVKDNSIVTHDEVPSLYVYRPCRLLRHTQAVWLLDPFRHLPLLTLV